MNHSITSHPCDNVSLAQLTELAQSGNSEAQYILGRLYNDERIDGSEEDKLSFYWLQQAAEQGHCEAQYWLGLRYSDTPTSMKDNAKASYWLEKAAKQGHKLAPNDLGGSWKEKQEVNQITLRQYSGIASVRNAGTAMRKIISAKCMKEVTVLRRIINWPFIGTNRRPYKVTLPPRRIWQICIGTVAARQKTYAWLPYGI